jgi:hypothetical protein
MTVNNQVVAESNNVGVAYLVAGQMKSALSHFCEALRMIMGALEQEPIILPYGGWSAKNAYVVSGGTERPLSLPRELDEKEKIVLLEKKSPPPVTAPFAYARGLNLIPFQGAYSSDLLIDSTVVSCIIIFNLSIVYHMNGLECGDGSICFLSRARTLYQKCQQLLAEAGVPLSATGNPVIDMLSMALFNNLAHVSFEMGLFDDARHCFELLSRFSVTVIAERYGDAYVGLMLDQQKTHFLLNSIVLQVPKVAGAA